MATGSFTANATISGPRFTADAFITDLDLLRHHRFWDHKWPITDLQVLLDEDVLTTPAGSTLRALLVDLWRWAAERR